MAPAAPPGVQAGMDHLLLLSLACGPKAPPAAEPARTWTPEASRWPRWELGGRLLRVDGDLVEVATGAAHVLPAGFEGGALSPSGVRVARVSYRSGELGLLEVRPVEDGETVAVEIPRFLDLSWFDDEDSLAKATTFIDDRAFWLDEGSLLLLQSTYQAVVDCAVFDLEARGISTPASGCPASDFVQLNGVERGPGELMATFSSGEGHPGVNVVRWTPSEQAPVGLPSLDLYPHGPLEVRFGSGAGSVWLQTPCDLHRERGCREVPEGDRVYRWDAEEPEVLVLVHEGIPAGTAYDPVHDRFGWVQGGALCWAAVGETPTCVTPRGP